MKPGQGNAAQNKKSSIWKTVAICLTVVLIPWALYVNFRPSISLSTPPADSNFHTTTVIHDLGQKLLQNNEKKTPTQVIDVKPVKKLEFPKLPVQGPEPVNGAVPLFGNKHKGTDAIFALACNYPKVYYQRFAGSLRKAGYVEDIVLAVSPVPKMKPGVEKYLQDVNVVAYGFDVDCEGTDNCKLKDDFLGYPDPRPFRTFANIRYALYEYWLRHYTENSYILILDFRDTFFQLNPFQAFGNFADRKEPRYDLQMFAENYDVSHSLEKHLSMSSLMMYLNKNR